MVEEFHSTASELLTAIAQVTETVDSVAKATDEGALGASDIAEKISEINAQSVDVMEKISSSKEASLRLQEEINKFIV